MTSILEAVVDSSMRLRDETKRYYKTAIRSFVQVAGDDPARWSGAAVEAWRDRLLEGGQGAGGINGYMYALRFASRRFHHLGHGPDFAAGAETLPVGGEKTRRALTEDEAVALIETCRRGRPPDLRDRAILTLGIRTGLRVDGMARLNRSDLAHDGQLTVQLKGGRRHTMPPLDGETLEALDVWLGWLAGQGVEGGRIFRALGRELVDGRHKIRRSITKGGIRAIVKRRAAEANLRHIHPHLFRHTFVSWCREHGIEDWKIALYTGHKTLPSGQVPTLTTYTSDVGGAPVGDLLPPTRR